MLSAIILAAGKGKRLGKKLSKPLVKINNIEAIIYSLSALSKHPDIDEIIVVCNTRNRKQIIRAVNNYSIKKIKVFILGGKRRQDSVSQGLKEVSEKSDWVLVHDCARPFIDRKFITKVISRAKKTGAAILGVPVKATIKLVDSRGSIDYRNVIVEKTLDRKRLWEIQTPQVFKKELIFQAYKKYSQEDVTDDAALIEKLGKRVGIVKGSPSNIKITTEEDLIFANVIAKGFKYAI